MTIATQDNKQNSDPNKLYLDIVMPSTYLYSFDPSKSVESMIKDNPLYQIQTPLYDFASQYKIDSSEVLKSATALNSVYGINLFDETKKISTPNYLTFGNPVLDSQSYIKPNQLTTFVGIEPISIFDAKKSITNSLLFIQPAQPTSLFFDTNVNATELLKANSMITSTLAYNDPSTLQIMKDTSFLSFPLEPLKSLEEKRIEVLESKIEEQQKEILEFKKLLKDERKEKKNMDEENARLRKLVNYDKALNYLADLDQQIRDTEEKVKNESIPQQNNKAEYSMYG